MRTPLLLASFIGLVTACSAPADLEESSQSTESALTRAPLEPPPPADHGSVPTAWLAFELQQALAGTLVNLTTFENDPDRLKPKITYFSKDTVCTPPPGVVTQCNAECGDVIGEAAWQACRAACARLGCVDNVCRSHQAGSFIRFPAQLKADSTPAQNENPNCNANTCPACASPSRVPTLRDTRISVPAYYADISPIPHIPIGYTSECTLKQLSFEVPSGSAGDPRWAATSDADGIHIALTGLAASPTITCNNAPNIQLGPSIRIDLVPSTSAGKLIVTVKAKFTGSIYASSWVNAVFVELAENSIRSAIDDKLSEKLSTLAGALIGEKFDAAARAQFGLGSYAKFTAASTDDSNMYLTFYR